MWRDVFCIHKPYVLMLSHICKTAYSIHETGLDIQQELWKQKDVTGLLGSEQACNWKPVSLNTGLLQLNTGLIQRS